MTKKFFAILLALVLTFAMSTVAFAATTYPDEPTVALGKIYKLMNASMTNPEETFTFTIEKYAVADSQHTLDTMPDFANKTVTIGFTKGEATVSGDRNTTDLNLPTFDKVGIYTYKITEVPGNNAGVDYDTNPIFLKVTVIQQDGLTRVAALHYETVTGEKVDDTGFTNTYKAGNLTVTKHVDGLLGDKTAYFPVKVTVAAPTKTDGETTTLDVAWANVGVSTPTTSGTDYAGNAFTNPTAITAAGTYTFYLKDGDSVVLSNLPYGVTYNVAEDTPASYNTPEITIEDNAVVDNAAETASVLNTKGGTVDTGITMDSIPYIVLLALAVVGIAAVTMKKRYEA